MLDRLHRHVTSTVGPGTSSQQKDRASRATTHLHRKRATLSSPARSSMRWSRSRRVFSESDTDESVWAELGREGPN